MHVAILVDDLDAISARMRDAGVWFQSEPQTKDPVFGIIKHVLGFRQFSLRGLDAVTGDNGLQFETNACAGGGMMGNAQNPSWQDMTKMKSGHFPIESLIIGRRTGHQNR